MSSTRKVNQLPEQPSALRLPDLCQVSPLLFGEPDGDEFGQARTPLVHDGQGAISGADHVHRGADDLMQYLGQFQFPTDRQNGVQQTLQAFLGACERVELLRDPTRFGVHAQALSERERVVVRLHGAPLRDGAGSLVITVLPIPR
ncbi:hypothetical protein ACIBJF_45995 [Streptomyces sp. NPDC050743]|uniref:hypothetical protein n=1 Tax=Streptomyces sp. NPDC050743 TaxID=3365634 RepID=UPI0037A87B82